MKMQNYNFKQEKKQSTSGILVVMFLIGFAGMVFYKEVYVDNKEYLNSWLLIFDIMKIIGILALIALLGLATYAIIKRIIKRKHEQSWERPVEERKLNKSKIVEVKKKEIRALEKGVI